MRYKKKTGDLSGATVIFDSELNRWIPQDPANADYQTFLAWVAAGNTPTEWTPE